MKLRVDAEMKEFVTPRQAAGIDAILKYGSTQDAAEALGITPGRLRGLMSDARTRAARKGWNSFEDKNGLAPPGYKVKGKSTYYKVGADGSMEARGQWVKTQVEEDHKLKLLLDAVQEKTEHLAPMERIRKPRSGAVLDDLLSVYPWGDPHFGMYAWALESGADFNLEIAERNMIAAVDDLVSQSPPSKEALIINLGDFFHADNMSNQTARSGHPLDVDTRWPKVLGIGYRAFRRCIDRCLEKHETVHVINEIGNHDDHTSMALSVILQSAYRNQGDRVKIDTSPRTVHWKRHGRCMIGVTHGHNTKAKDLPLYMASQREKDWGETKYRYWYTGHVHHDSLKELVGATVETFRTLAPKDAWHASKGYESLRDMKCDVLHKHSGRRFRIIVPIEEIE